MSLTPKQIDHWETLFDSTYLRWYHLRGNPALVRITSIERAVEMTLPGGVKAKKPVMYFEQVNGCIEEVKPLVLNKTNGNLLAELIGTVPSKWAGQDVVLYQASTKMFDKDLRKMVDKFCIRVRGKKSE